MNTEITIAVAPASVASKVDALYEAATAKFPTYETVVHRSFCESMLQAFPDPQSTEGAQAFQYAIGEYGYLTPEEIAAEDSESSNDGICSHGLDFWTCPKGCFG